MTEQFTVSIADDGNYIGRVWYDNRYRSYQVVEKYSGENFCYGVYFTSKENGEVLFENAYRSDLLEDAVLNAAYNDSNFNNKPFIARIENIYGLRKPENDTPRDRFAITNNQKGLIKCIIAMNNK